MSETVKFEPVPVKAEEGIGKPTGAPLSDIILALDRAQLRSQGAADALRGAFPPDSLHVVKHQRPEDPTLSDTLKRRRERRLNIARNPRIDALFAPKKREHFNASETQAKHPLLAHPPRGVLRDPQNWFTDASVNEKWDYLQYDAPYVPNGVVPAVSKKEFSAMHFAHPERKFALNEVAFSGVHSFHSYAKPELEPLPKKVPKIMCHFDDEYRMVDFVDWEDEIVWDSDSIPEQRGCPSKVSVSTFEDPEFASCGWLDDIAWDETDKKEVAPIILDENDALIFLERGNPSAKLFPDHPRCEDKAFNHDDPLLDPFYGCRADDEEEEMVVKTQTLTAHVQHSEPALRLETFQTYLGEGDKIFFHRPRARFYPGSNHRVFPRKPRFNTKKSRKRGPPRTIAELTSMDDSNIILVEHRERFPTPISGVGMGGTIRNYYRRAQGVEMAPPPEIGDSVLLGPNDESPFGELGDAIPGTYLPVMENKMVRMPVVRHEPNENDFIIAMDGNGNWKIREIDTEFLAGQQFHLQDVRVPSPNNAPQLLRKKVVVFIVRHLRANPQNFLVKKDITYNFDRTDELSKKVLPEYCQWIKKSTQHAIKDGGRPATPHMNFDSTAGCYIARKDIELPEIQTIMTPEEACLYEASLSGEALLNRDGISKIVSISTVDKLTRKDLDPEAAEGVKLLYKRLLMTPWYLTMHFDKYLKKEENLDFGANFAETDDMFSFIPQDKNAVVKNDRLDVSKARRDMYHRMFAAQLSALAATEQVEPVSGDELSDMDMDFGLESEEVVPDGPTQTLEELINSTHRSIGRNKQAHFRTYAETEEIDGQRKERRRQTRLERVGHGEKKKVVYNKLMGRPSLELAMGKVMAEKTDVAESFLKALFLNNDKTPNAGPTSKINMELLTKSENFTNHISEDKIQALKNIQLDQIVEEAMKRTSRQKTTIRARMVPVDDKILEASLADSDSDSVFNPFPRSERPKEPPSQLSDAQPDITDATKDSRASELSSQPVEPGAEPAQMLGSSGFMESSQSVMYDEEFHVRYTQGAQRDKEKIVNRIQTKYFGKDVRPFNPKIENNIMKVLGHIRARKTSELNEVERRVLLNFMLDKVWYRVMSQNWVSKLFDDLKSLPDYTTIIPDYTDMQRIKRHIRRMHYRSRWHFLSEFQQMAGNCAVYQAVGRNPHPELSRASDLLCEQVYAELMKLNDVFHYMEVETYEQRMELTAKHMFEIAEASKKEDAPSAFKFPVQPVAKPLGEFDEDGVPTKFVPPPRPGAPAATSEAPKIRLKIVVKKPVVKSDCEGRVIDTTLR